MNDYTVLTNPLTTEKSVRMMEMENKMTFVVNKKATKAEIKKAFESMFSVKVDKVNTHITNGKKIAIIALNPNFIAMDIATQLGIL